jgi:hypothetical protein
MRSVFRILGSVLLVALALLALAPPTLLAPALARASAGALSLVEAEGTLWRGQGTLLADGQRLPLAWQIDPLQLFRGEIAVRVTPQAASGPTPRGLVVISLHGVAVADAAFALPAAVLVSGAAGPVPWVASGNILATTRRLESRDNALAGAIDLHWRRAGLRLASGGPALELGDVAAPLKGGADRLAGPITNSGGAVSIEGEISGGLRGGFAANVLLVPRASLDPGVSALLRSVGRPEGAGWRLAWPRGTR